MEIPIESNNLPLQFGRYELLHLLATGGMGEIYLARSTGAAGFEKQLVIKKILPHLAQEEEFIAKFIDEAKIVVRLTHGNIIPVFDMGVQNGEYFIAMEYIPGRDLRYILKEGNRKNKIPVEIALYIINEVCKGLSYAHRKTDEADRDLNIIHRDISPSNILLSEEGEIKIGDFGVAKATGKLTKSVTGRLQGKFCYMSPEQASGKPLDKRSDIFATGIVLYELLTGIRPFEDTTDLGSLDKVRKALVQTPSEIRPEISHAVDNIVLKALSKNRNQRYQHIDEMQRDIIKYLSISDTLISGVEVNLWIKKIFPKGLDPIKTLGNPPTATALSLDDAFQLEANRMLGFTPSNPDIDPLTITRTQATKSVPSGEVISQSGSLGQMTPNLTPTSASGEFLYPSSQTDRLIAISSDTYQAPPKSRKKLILFLLFLPFLLFGLAYGVDRIIINPVIVTITSSPEGARIFINNEDTQKITPATFYADQLPPGQTHTIELRKENHEPVNISLPLNRGSRQRFSTKLELLVTDDAIKPIRPIMISSFPDGAKIIIDDNFMGITPKSIDIPTDRLFTLSLELDGYQNAKKAFDSNEIIGDELKLELLPVVEIIQKDITEQPEVSEEDSGETSNLVALTDTSEKNQPDQEKPKEVKQPEVRPRLYTITSKPDGATVFYKDTKLGVTPYERKFKKNSRLTLKKEGYESCDIKVRPKSDKNREVSCKLTVMKSQNGFLNVSAGEPHYAEIHIDGNRVGETPLIEFQLAPGKHEIWLINDHPNVLKRERFEVTILPGETTSLKAWPKK